MGGDRKSSRDHRESKGHATEEGGRESFPAVAGIGFDREPSKRDELVSAARDLYESKGMSKTTVKDITAAVGATRTLFYHYFPDKAAITTAVLDCYVMDFKESVFYWNQSRVQGDIEGALRSCIKMMRRALFDADPFRKDLASSENAALYLQFVTKAAAALSDYVVETTVSDYRRFHDVEIDHVNETFQVLIIGIVGYLRSHPDADDEVLMAIIAQSLRLEL